MRPGSRIGSLAARACRKLPGFHPAPGPPHRVAVHPRLRTEAELLDCWHKARHFLVPEHVAEVVIPVDPSVSLARSDPATWPLPDYLVGGASSGAPKATVVVTPRDLPLRMLCRHHAILALDWRAVDGTWAGAVLGPALRNADRHAYVWEGWSWAGVCASFQSAAARGAQAATAQREFDAYVARLPRYDRCYLFGTGPSLDQAAERRFDDGYRVVCNTVVRNRPLLDHIAPHFIVAADAIYHYGNNRHAAAFRADLVRALCEREMRLLVPDTFYPLLASHHPEIVPKVIPVRTDLDGVHLDMKRCLAYSNLPNILNGLMLPLASSLAAEVFLLGFDGRGPGAPAFWANSAANSYPELKDTIKAAHPEFFRGIDYDRYAAEQSDAAERVMAEGERLGKRYTCLNRTFIPALRARMLQSAGAPEGILP